MTEVELLVAVLMVVGLIGIVFPVLPGLLIITGAVLLWAVTTGTTTGWVVFGVALTVYLTGSVLQWLIPGRRMRRAGVRTSTLLAGVVCAIIMAFVIPVVGLFVGFPLGIFLVSLARSRDAKAALVATRHALQAVGLNILIELATAFTIIAIWAVAVIWVVD